VSESRTTTGPVLVLGNNTVDLVFRMPGTIPRDGKVQAESLTVTAGGQAANVAHALALLGVPVRYVGAFGGDDDSALSRRSLEDVGVDTSRCIAVAGCPAHRAAVLVDTRAGGRSIVMYKDSRLELAPEVITPELMGGVRLVYLDNHEPRASAVAARLARARGIPVVADLESVSDLAVAVLTDVDVLIAPAEVLSGLTEENDVVPMLRAVQRLGPRTVVATAGPRGADGVEALGPPTHVPSRPCPVVDSTGAGDAFHAGYIAALLRGADFPARLELATAVAARKCGVAGPRLTADDARTVLADGDGAVLAAADGGW
jgi:sulfofructose kinase